MRTVQDIVLFDLEDVLEALQNFDSIRETVHEDYPECEKLNIEVRVGSPYVVRLTMDFNDDYHEEDPEGYN